MRKLPVTQAPPIDETTATPAQSERSGTHEDEDTRIVFGSWDEPLVPTR